MRTFLVVLASLAAAQSGLAAAQTGRPAPTPAERAQADAALNAWTSDRLVTFDSEQAFARYLHDVRAAAQARGLWWVGGGHIQFAQAGQPDTPPPPVCPPENPDCVGYPAPPQQGGRDIIVTASRILRPNMVSASPVTTISSTTAPGSATSITNNQVAAVDEGDIVKQIGRHLLVLQDGRIFVIDTRGGRGRRLTITDRANVYRDPQSDAWYDEMVVYGRRVMITGYSYHDHVAEIAVFDLTENGRLSRAGTFHIRSNDYYSGENYSTRLVGDRLILYSPIDLTSFEQDKAIAWPRLERVDGNEGRSADGGRPLLEARSIYRPMLTSWQPTLHAISIRRLGPLARRELACRSTGFVGPAGGTLFVSPRAAFLWTWGQRGGETNDYGDDPCPDITPPDPTRSDPARVYRLPVDRARPGVLASYGGPFDQLGMDASGRRFHALLETGASHCRTNVKARAISYFSAPETAFANRVGPADPASFTPMPPLMASAVENRFTDRWLVFGGRLSLTGLPGENDDGNVEDHRASAGQSRIVAVPIDHPRDYRLMDVPHNVIRAERAGDNIVLTGYRGDEGLSISVVGLRGAEPKITDTIVLPGRFESEGRSHAFNSATDAEGAGLMGLPTVLRTEDADRWWWRSGASDVSFATIDARGRLGRAGTLHSSRRSDEQRPDFTRDGEGHNGYVCEVSCIDWYGNTRPIFTDGRVFALTGTELIEGRMGNDDRIDEVQRLDLTSLVGAGAARSDGAGAASGE